MKKSENTADLEYPATDPANAHIRAALSRIWQRLNSAPSIPPDPIRAFPSGHHILRRRIRCSRVWGPGRESAVAQFVRPTSRYETF